MLHGIRQGCYVSPPISSSGNERSPLHLSILKDLRAFRQPKSDKQWILGQLLMVDD